MTQITLETFNVPARNVSFMCVTQCPIYKGSHFPHISFRLDWAGVFTQSFC